MLMLALTGCAFDGSASTAVERLQTRFNQPWPESTYMVATVDTPQGLWNVYVVSIQPDQVAIRQSRQDGEYEFGMIGDLIWHVAFGKSPPVRLDTEWRWFMRNHEVFRFSEWVSGLRFDLGAASGDQSTGECTPVLARDAFDLGVRLCVDSVGDPLWIERQTPPAYGGSTVRIVVDRWDEYGGHRFPGKFRQIQSGTEQTWEIQGFQVLAADHPGLSPPEGLDDSGKVLQH
jgi:hypothetical protein